MYAAAYMKVEEHAQWNKEWIAAFQYAAGKIMPLLTPAAIAFGVLNESRLLPLPGWCRGYLPS